jgi:hypothetical protein
VRRRIGADATTPEVARGDREERRPDRPPSPRAHPETQSVAAATAAIVARLGFTSPRALWA